MSWDFYTNKEVKARKEYRCDWYEHLDMCGLIHRDNQLKKWVVDKPTCIDAGLSDDEISILEAYCDDDFKIRVGELHRTTSGKIEGTMCTFRGKIAISDIMHKYDLVNED